LIYEILEILILPGGAWGSYLPSKEMSSRRDWKNYRFRRDDILLARRSFLATKQFSFNYRKASEEWHFLLNFPFLQKPDMSKNLRFVLLAGMAMLSAYLPAQTIVKTFPFGGATRSTRIYVPPSYNAANPAPLVFNLHGYTSNALQQEFYSEMNAVADTAGFIVVYPDGLNETWNSGLVPNSVNDVGFISILIDSMQANYNIDPTRVYSCGMSMGGYMSFKLACDLDDRIAAIASVTGAFATGVASNCTATRPVPVLQMHGTLDGVVNYAGFTGSLSVDSTLGFWRALNNCTAQPVVTNLPDVVNEGSTITTYLYAGCQDNVEVLHYKVLNGSHSWPGALPLVPGITNQDIEASVEIWNFFNRFTHPNPTLTSVEEDIAVEFPGFYPQPAGNVLRLESTSEQMEVEIWDLNGRQMGQWQVDAGQELILETETWAAGVYLAHLRKGELTHRTKIAVY
jgi:polyhydroxybutyrate depolymerase